jgi:hypothetical protein
VVGGHQDYVSIWHGERYVAQIRTGCSSSSPSSSSEIQAYFFTHYSTLQLPKSTLHKRTSRQVLAIPSSLFNVDLVGRDFLAVTNFCSYSAQKADMVMPGLFRVMIQASIAPSLHQFAATRDQNDDRRKIWLHFLMMSCPANFSILGVSNADKHVATTTPTVVSFCKASTIAKRLLHRTRTDNIKAARIVCLRLGRMSI